MERSQRNPRVCLYLLKQMEATVKLRPRLLNYFSSRRLTTPGSANTTSRIQDLPKIVIKCKQFGYTSRRT